MAVNLKMPRKAGGNAEPELSEDRAQLIQDLHGKHYEDCLAGRVFSHTPTPLGLEIPVYTETDFVGGMPIWNPSNSNVRVELISLTVGKASGTADFGAIVLMHRNNVGTDIAAGSEITAFAETVPFNGFLGAGLASRVKSSSAGTCTCSAGVAAEAIRSFHGSGVAADLTATPLDGFHHDFNGTVIVPPGTVIWVAMTQDSSALYCTTFVWKELRIR